MLLTTVHKCLYITELTISFEINFDSSAQQKETKYRSLLKHFTIIYCKVSFIILSISCLGTLVKHQSHFFEMCSNSIGAKLLFNSYQKMLIMAIFNMHF